MAESSRGDDEGRGHENVLRERNRVHTRNRREKTRVHGGNLRCPVMQFCEGEYTDTVVSCHGSGYPSHSKLNEHLNRMHSPKSVRNEGKPAPLLDKELFDAWKRSKRTNAKTEQDIQEKWWNTVEMLGLGKRPEDLRTDDTHLASPADKIPREFKRELDAQFRSGQGAGSSTRLDPSMGLVSTPKDAEKVSTPDHTTFRANDATETNDNSDKNKAIDRYGPHEKCQNNLGAYLRGYLDGFQDGLGSLDYPQPAGFCKSATDGNLPTVNQRLGHTSSAHNVPYKGFSPHDDSGFGSMGAQGSSNDTPCLGDGDGDGDGDDQGHSELYRGGKSQFVESPQDQFDCETLPDIYAETVELDGEDERTPGTV